MKHTSKWWLKKHPLNVAFNICVTLIVSHLLKGKVVLVTLQRKKNLTASPRKKNGIDIGNHVRTTETLQTLSSRYLKLRKEALQSDLKKNKLLLIFEWWEHRERCYLVRINFCAFFIWWGSSSNGKYRARCKRGCRGHKGNNISFIFSFWNTNFCSRLLAVLYPAIFWGCRFFDKRSEEKNRCATGESGAAL